MRLYCLFVLCFMFYTCSAKEEDVLEFGDKDFESRIAEYETALVMFYAPWCGHCKKLKPEFAKAAEDLLRQEPPLALVKVDCTEAGKETCNQRSVTGYPTLKIFRNGQLAQDYNGPREAAGIVKYMKAQVGPSSQELKNVEDFEIFLRADRDVSVVGFFETESGLKTSFLKLADTLREKVRFAHSSSKSVLEKQGIADGIVLFRPEHLHNKFEDTSVTFSGNADVEDISDWIFKNYHGLVGHRKSDNKKNFKLPLVVAYYKVDYLKNPKGTNYWRNRILKVAKQYQGQINFAVSAKDEFQNELNEYGIDFVKSEDPLVLARDIKNQKFIMKDDFSIVNLGAFVQDMLDNKIEPYLKSEAIPEKNDEPVTVAVAKNFNDVVTNNGKDTLIEFYAPWCGHCKKLTPIFEELGEKLKDEDVAIIKMDATANDVSPIFDVRGFPTLYWLPKNDRSNPVSYNEGRDLKDFIEFIAKHSTNELNGYDRKGNPKAEKTEL